MEDTVGKAVTRGLVDNKKVNKMIHAMLCTGLQTSLKDISGHTFDDIQDFNALRITLQLGKDHGRRHSVKKTHPQLKQQKHVAIHKL